jgi:hypothetical protein
MHISLAYYIIYAAAYKTFLDFVISLEFSGFMGFSRQMGTQKKVEL